MQADLHQAILQLLTNEGELVLPGLGTFRLQAQPASVSTIEGRTRPPAKVVIFNNNLKLDDGRLLRHLTEQEGLGEEQANQVITSYIEGLSREINAGRMVPIEGVGRLFKDHTGEIRFNAGDHNLDKNAFGLPDVAIAPIIRTERVSPVNDGPIMPFESTIPTPQSLEELQSEPEVLSVLWGRIRENIWLIALTTIVIFLAGLFYIQQRDAKPTLARMDRQAPPAPNDDVAPPPASRPAQSQPQLPPPTIDETTTTSTPAPVTTTPATTQKAVIGLYRLGNRKNVDRSLQQIQEAGYTPFTEESNRLTRVGIQVEFSSDRQLDEILSKIRRSFTQDAFILEKNGQRYRQ